MKKVFSLVLFVILTVAVSVTAFAADSDIIASGYCGGEGDGTNLEWVLTEDGTLTISGEGKMADYDSQYKNEVLITTAPWGTYTHKLSILVLENGITTIGEYAFMGCTGFTGSLTIPDSVTTIGMYAFHTCSGFIGNLVIPDSVQNIGEYAFYRCYDFAGELVLGNGLTRVDDYAFSFCNNIGGDITLNNNLVNIGKGVFGNTGIENIFVLDNNPNYISINGILYSKDLKTVVMCPGGKKGNLVIYEGTTEIGNAAFSGCNGLTGTLVIPESVTTIGNAAFDNCYGFTGNLIIHNNIVTIGSFAFRGCEFGGKLIIGENVTTIGESAFRGCIFKDSLVIPEKVESIEFMAFAWCEINEYYFKGDAPEIGELIFDADTDTIYYPSGNSTWEVVDGKWNGYNTVGIIDSGYCGGEGDGTNLSWTLTEDGALTISGTGKMADYETWYGPDESYTLAPWGEYKNQINSLVLEEGITRIGDNAFGLMRIEGELIIPSTVKSIGTFSFEHNSFSQKNLVIPEGVEKIETGAFQAGGNFENVYIPASVKRIEGVSFRYGSTKNIIVDENNSDYKSVEGVLFTKDGTKIMQFPAGRNGKYVVPEEVSVIEEGAFENSKLSLITVKGKIERIRVLAFRGFVGMVAFEQNVYEMEDTVFESYNLPVEILFMAGPPEKILMEDGRFTFGRNCEIFYLSGTEDLWDFDENGLWNGYEVKPFNTYEEVELDPSLYVASGYCGNDPITDGKNLAWGIDENGTLTIFGKGEMADYENGKLENGQWGINSPWYQYRNDISSIKIEEGITRISDYAFSGAYETDGKVTIPESVMSIGDYAFQSVAEGSVTIPSAVVEIGNSPFANCIYLEEINVAKENQTFCSVDGKLYSKDMKTLYAWPNLRNEKTAVVPEGVTTIATGAFDRLVGKNMNVDIILPETVKILENDTFIVNGRVIVKGQLDFVSTYALSPWGGSLSFYFFNGPPKEASKYAFDAEADGPIGLYYLSGTEDLWEFDEKGLWNGYEVNEYSGYGDLNSDFTVDVKDVYLARLVAAKLVVLTEEEFSLGDVDGNGRINAIDANLIRKFCANIITKFPVEG